MLKVIKEFFGKRKSILEQKKVKNEHHSKIAKLRNEYNSAVKEFEKEFASSIFPLQKEYRLKVSLLKEQYDKAAQLLGVHVSKDSLIIYWPEPSIEGRNLRQEFELVAHFWGKGELIAEDLVSCIGVNESILKTYIKTQKDSKSRQYLEQYPKVRDEFLLNAGQLVLEYKSKTAQFKTEFDFKVAQLMREHELKETQLNKEYDFGE